MSCEKNDYYLLLLNFDICGSDFEIHFEYLDNVGILRRNENCRLKAGGFSFLLKNSKIPNTSEVSPRYPNEFNIK